ncbi:MAG: hypothetical protein M1822_001562 [Bathelium mastoideum]|nr:MAG: hypothetical protein M1822_001562 [Bathelium mastoideum]
MATDDLVAEALQPSRSFNWLFLVTLLVCAVLAIFFLFYFNRLFATLVSYGIRAYSWHAFNAYVDIQALQISPLGGRIFFKGVRYHAHNETILVHGGYITWQYWLRRVKNAEIFNDDFPAKTQDPELDSSSGSPELQNQSRNRHRSIGREEKGGKKPTKQLPCRIEIKVSGVEAFLYNRSPAYDLIVDGIAKKQQRQQYHHDYHHRDAGAGSSVEDDVSARTSLNEKRNDLATAQSRSEYRPDDELGKEPTTQRSRGAPVIQDKGVRSLTPPAFLKMLPVRVRCKKGAIVLGNENTKCVTTAKFENAVGELNAGRSGPFDLFKLLVDFEVEHPVVQLHPNHDFKGSQLASAAHKKHHASPEKEHQENDHRRPFFSRRHHSKNFLRRWSPLFCMSTDSVATASASRRKSVPPAGPMMELPGQAHWQGLTRYLDEDQHNEHDEWDPVEYARLPILADLPKVKVSFFWDIPGPVPGHHEIQDSSYLVDYSDINGSVPPEYGLDILVFGGVVNYGPWTDRQRMNIQSVFFPPVYTDAIPAERLTPGQDRYSTVFKIFVSVEEEVVLRLPVRESSKDWKWKGHAEAYEEQARRTAGNQKSRGSTRRRRGKKQDRGLPTSNVRPFGWFDVKVGANTTVNYSMDMVASQAGYDNVVDLDVTKLEITTSVNHNLLWRSGRQVVSCDLSNPLQWNRVREWTFNIGSYEAEIFLLTDHLVLLLDLINDWGTGPQPDFYTFLPMRYLLNIDFYNFKLYINTNDSNIINNPSDLDDNNFIILYGRLLSGKVTIPLDRFRPVQNSVLFDAVGRDFGLEMSTPTKSPMRTFMPDKNVARLSDLKADGSHNFYSETDPNLTDRLVMNIHGGRFSLDAYGFLLRQFANFKENYFGEDLHFRTLEEFQGLERVPTRASTIGHFERTDKSNALDVILCISAEGTSIQLPANLYDKKENIQLELATAALDLRFTNYYMDMMLNTSPLGIALGTAATEASTPDDAISGTQIFLDGVNMYGHRLFGLPPAEPAYMGDWNLDVGAITGECSNSFLTTLVKAGRAIAFTLPDYENAMPVPHPTIVHDVTFLKVHTQTIRLWFHVDQDALMVSTGPADIDFNDWTGPLFSQHLGVLLPDVRIACLDARSALRHRTGQREKMTLETYALLETNIQLDMLKQNAHFTRERAMQQDHISLHDQKTQRINFLLEAGRRYADGSVIPTGIGMDPPAMPFPPVPLPTMQHKDQDSSSHQSKMSSIATSVRSMSSVASFLNHQSHDKSDGSHLAFTSVDRGANRDGSQSRPLMNHTLWSCSHPPPQTSRFDLPGDNERGQKRLASSNVTFSSPFICPYFPLEACEPDMSDAPQLPKYPGGEPDFSDEVIFTDATAEGIDESTEHTSLIIRTEPGISVLCKPQAIGCVLNLVDSILSRAPEDLLDDFQFSVVTEILGTKARKHGKGNNLDFSIRVPFVCFRFLAPFSKAFRASNADGHDRYEVALEKIALSTRIRVPPVRATEQELTLVHATVRSLSVSVSEMFPGDTANEVAVHLVLDKTLLWISSKDNISVNVSFRGCSVAVVSKKTDYLTTLVHRNVVMAENYQTQFRQAMDAHCDRLRYLAYELTLSGGDIADPPFLTRATYVLQAAEDHLRFNDSWKILSRFRYIYHCLPATRKKEIAINCVSQRVICPLEAESNMIRSWEGWRSWDLAGIKESIAMRFLYGATGDIPVLHQRKPVAVNVAVRARTLQLLVDPGPKQNEVGLETLTLVLSTTPRQAPSGLMLVNDAAPTRSTVVQINTAKVGIKISWEILELADALSGLFRGPYTRKTNEQKLRRTIDDQPHSLSSAGDQNIHVVFATDQGSISLDTINLSQIARSKSLKLSIATEVPGNEDGALSISAVAHAEAATSEMSGQQRLLWRIMIAAPTISVVYSTANRSSGRPDNLQVTGATERLVIEIKDEILGLMEVLESVINDEIVYVHTRVKGYKNRASPAESSAAATTFKQPPHLQVALFMNRYRIEAALLRSLCYSISGNSSSLAMAPDESKSFALDVDYDLGKQLHEVINNVPDQSFVVAGLGFPSVNGRIKFVHNDKENILSVQTAVESIDLDAAAINALAIALARPEVTKVFTAIKQNGSALKDHFENVIGKPNVSDLHVQKAEAITQFVYEVRATLAGFVIGARAPTASETTSLATIVMSLENAQITATNRLGLDVATLPFPEVRARLGEIDLTLQSVANGIATPCGNVSLGLLVHCTSQTDRMDKHEQQFIARSSRFEVNMYAETASAVVDVINHLQDKMKELDLSGEVPHLGKFRHAKKEPPALEPKPENNINGGLADTAAALLASSYSLELQNIQVSWIVGESIQPYEGQEIEDLVLSFTRIDLSTRKTDEARLLIESMRLQMVPRSRNKKERSLNSASFPELVFNVAYESSNSDRRVALHAAGKRIDFRLQSYFVLPASILERSISSAIAKCRKSTATWEMTPTISGAERKNLFGDKSLSSLIVDADFAGALVLLERRNHSSITDSTLSPLTSDRIPQQGKFGQFVDNHNESIAQLHTPGVALKLEYQDLGGIEPFLKAEVMVDASANILYPAFVPLVMEISKGVKEVVRDQDEKSSNTVSKAPQKLIDGELIGADPSTLLGRVRLNLGLKICKQEFSLTCHPYARVAATARFEDIYLTLSTIRSTEQGNFFAISGIFTKLEARVRHVYSREDTFRVDVESIVLSLMNSKHLSGESGISAILKIAPARTILNVKQLQDFLLFREIWIPPEVRGSASAVPASPGPVLESQEYLVQKYHQVASVAAFPWNASVAIAELALEIDLGQAIGKSTFTIKDFWIHSKKTSNWEQNLCAGIGNAGIDSTGRMSGYVSLQGLRLRTSIAWPLNNRGLQQTPLIQASIGIHHLRVKAAFDYQAFGIADITDFDFLMYNVREQGKVAGDRLVAMLDGDKVQVFCTATSASQALSLVQAFDRLIQEKQAAFTQSLREVEASLKRKSVISLGRPSPVHRRSSGSLWKRDEPSTNTLIKLHTDVMVTLKSINVGAFPSTFFDNQIFKLEAEETSARFAVTLEDDKIHSRLGMTLGQLRVALSSVRNTTLPKPLGEVTVEEVVSSATGSRGGTILKVPKVVATMQTWQIPSSNHIDYSFKSSFEGKVDVGWNYSRISFIRTMWGNHSRSLASRLGKPLPESAVKITAGPSSSTTTAEKSSASFNRASEAASTSGSTPRTNKELQEQEKITAVVNVPQSRYEYAALEPPIIETPQLRDMGEATPPLEWIGLHRDRLPNITHQIVIVTLLEVAKEVENAYERILGSNLEG